MTIQDDSIAFFDTQMSEVRPARAKRKLSNHHPPTHNSEVDRMEPNTVLPESRFHALEPPRNLEEPPTKRHRPAPAKTSLPLQQGIPNYKHVKLNRTQHYQNVQTDGSEWEDFLDNGPADTDEHELVEDIDSQWEVV